MYLGDMLKRMIDVAIKVLRLPTPDTKSCGCERRRIALNLIGWKIRDTFRVWWYEWRHKSPRKLKVRTTIDLDRFECQWQGVASGLADVYLTSNSDTYNSLKLSGYNVEMKHEGT